MSDAPLPRYLELALDEIERWYAESTDDGWSLSSGLRAGDALPEAHRFAAIRAAIRRYAAEAVRARLEEFAFYFDDIAKTSPLVANTLETVASILRNPDSLRE